jgi:hypothetical protein
VRHFIDLINFQSAVFSLDLAPCRCFLGLGCSRTEIAARSRVSVIMRRLRGRLARQTVGEEKLKAASLHKLTEPSYSACCRSSAS